MSGATSAMRAAICSWLMLCAPGTAPSANSAGLRTSISTLPGCARLARAAEVGEDAASETASYQLQKEAKAGRPDVIDEFLGVVNAKRFSNTVLESIVTATKNVTR